MIVRESKGTSFTAGIWRTCQVPAVVFSGLMTITACAVAIAGCVNPSPSAHPIDLDGAAPEVADAVRAAQERVQAGEPSAANWFTLGLVCEANGLSVDARRAYEQVTTLDDRHARAWYRLAIMRARAGELDAALAAIDRLIAIDPAYAPSHWRRGLWLLDAAKDEEARAAFERATTLDPASPGGWVGLARIALHRREEAQAVEVLERFLSQHPGDRYALRLLGTAYHRLGRADDADYALKVGATGEPSWPDPWTEELGQHRVGFAQTLKAATAGVVNGQFDKAVPMLEQLHRERPDDLSLMHQLGLSYVAVGRAADGVALLQQALARDPENVESHLRLASAYLNTGDYQQSLRHAERAVSLSPELARAHETLGMALWRGGRPLDALAAFQQTTRFDPTNVDVSVWMGSILLDAGREGEALAHFERAADANPSLADAYVGIGLVHLRRRQLDDADAVLQRAARLAPDNPRVRAALASLEAAAANQARRR